MSSFIHREDRGESAAAYTCTSCGFATALCVCADGPRDPETGHTTSAAYVDLLAAAKRVTRAYTAEAEDWNGGEFALWRKDDLVVALVELRKLVGDG